MSKESSDNEGDLTIVQRTEKTSVMDAEAISAVLKSLKELNANFEDLKISTRENQEQVQRLNDKIQPANELAMIAATTEAATATAEAAAATAEVAAREIAANLLGVSPLSTSGVSQATYQPPATYKLHDLPTFSGNVEEWPLFLANFKDSTEDFRYNNRQNLQRLQKCLVGPAREAVAAMLINVQNVPDIIDELSFRFGRPDILVRHQLNKIQRFPTMSETKMEQLLAFSTQVRNVVAFLKSSNSEHSLNNSTLLDELVSKLPQDKQYEWVKHTTTLKAYPTIADFSKWLCELARIVCLMPTPSTSKNAVTTRQTHQQAQSRRVLHINNAATSATQPDVQNTHRCYQCGGNHFIAKCNVFGQFGVEERWQKVKTLRLCFSCLRKGHSTANCRGKKVCGIDGCRRYHHSSLHNEPQSSPAMSTTAAQPVLSCRTTNSIGLLFKIMPVTLLGPNGKVDVFAMFDEGSSISLLEEDTANKLGLKGRHQPLTLQWYGQNVTKEPSTTVNLEVRGMGEFTSFVVKNCRTIKNLNLPVQTFDKSEHEHLACLPIKNYRHAKPVVLLGLDNAHLGISSTFVQSGNERPIAIKTKLGWVAYGPNNNVVTTSPFVLHIREQQPQDDLHTLIQEYFAADNFGINPSPTILESDENKRARQIMHQTTKRIGKQFETGLLWKSIQPSLPSSFKMAEKRLIGIEKKMSQNKDFAAKYICEMTKYIHKGYAKKLQQPEIDDMSQPLWYLPHFAVQSPHKPEKLRIVFDAAATVDGTSLNSALLKGPEQAKPLMSILFKFREGEIGVAADIREMFSQVQIRPSDQQAQRFLWRNGDRNQPIDHYVMTSMIFGAICSPCSAEFIKNLNAQEFQIRYPEASDAIVNKHYVDDFVASFRSENEAEKICKEVVKINSEAGFDLRNFTSNSKALQSSMNAESSTCAKTVNIECQANSDKVLGLYWNTASDCFEFKTKFHRIPKEVLEEIRPPTKRELLGIVMAIFDPYGLLADFLLFLKILVRDTWKSNIAWDEPLTADINKKWQAWWKEFHGINKIQIQRCYSLHLLGSNTIELHIFMDASQVAFAAAGYFRICHARGVDVVFVCGKTRGAPQKTMSVPRLELQAAVLGIRLSKIIVRNHDINISQITFWSDSRTVLCWINSTERRFKAFVSYRVAEILSSSQPSQWRWTPTDKNSADVATRTNGSPRLKDNSVWISGPDFLKKSDDCWPVITTQPPPEGSEQEEIKTCLLLQESEGNLAININRFSSYLKLKRTMAYVLRAVSKFGSIIKREWPRPTNRFLMVAEINEAEIYLCRMVQQERYHTEIATLKSSKPIPKSSPIYSLSPYLDERNLLRVQGRIDEAICLPLQARRPILLPQKHILSELIMRYYHEKCHHQNTAMIVNESRQKFWFPHVKALLKLVQKNCMECKIQEAKPVPPFMGQLLIDRLTPYVRPFTYTGVDLFGPLNVTIGRRQEKRWGVIFTCLTVRAAHIELAENLSTDAFLICLRNFINRRGTPVRIRSDNGTNFIGANREMKEEQHLFDFNRIYDEATSQNIEWVFNCPANPSSGGCWERLIRIIKRLMSKTLNQEAPRVETLRSVLIEAENIINSRPLTDIPLALEDDEPLTPNHFLLGCVNSTQTPHPVQENICLRKQWRIAQNLKDRLWKKWTVEYLPQLLRRPKWHDKVRPLQVNDLVMICESNQQRSQWRKGRISQVFPAKDGQIRLAEVKTTNGLIRRPASKLAVLTIDGESRSDSRGEEC